MIYGLQEWVTIASNNNATYTLRDRLEAKNRHLSQALDPISRAYFRFDTTRLSEGSAVTSAVVRIRLNETGSPLDYAVSGVNFSAVTTPWSNSAVDFAEGCYLITNFLKSSPAYAPPALGWYEVDVTSVVSNWYAGSATNCGFTMRLVQEGPWEIGFDLL